MLPFGSITSLVPLIVLAFAYFVYFSAAFLTKHAPQDTGLSDKGEKIIITSDENPDYPDFRNIKDNTHDYLAENNSFTIRDFTCIVFHENLHEVLAPPHISTGFSPRPPPAA